jgi:hypothetical protein
MGLNTKRDLPTDRRSKHNFGFDFELQSVPRVQADLKTTVALRVVGGDEKDPSAWGYNWATLFLGDINTGT